MISLIEKIVVEETAQYAKTMRKCPLGRFFVVMALIMLCFMGSCRNDENPIGREADYVAEEAMTDAYFEDLDDLADVAVVSDDGTVTGGKAAADGRRTIHISDNRFTCADVTIEFGPNSILHPNGTITIDFGAGCEDPMGNTRRGKIIIQFSGRRFIPGSFLSLTLDGYEINSVQLSGTRTITVEPTSTSDQPVYGITLKSGKIVWPGGASATRDHSFTRLWIRSENKLIVKGSANGVNRDGKTYTMKIDPDRPLVYKRFCPIAVSGVKHFSSESGAITIDYGDGDCDRSVSLIVNNQRQDISVTN